MYFRVTWERRHVTFLCRYPTLIDLRCAYVFCLFAGCRGKEDHPAGLRDVRGTLPKGTQGPQPEDGRGVGDQGHHVAKIYGFEGLQGHGKACLCRSITQGTHTHVLLALFEG